MSGLCLFQRVHCRQAQESHPVRQRCWTLARPRECAKLWGQTAPIFRGIAGWQMSCVIGCALILGTPPSSLPTDAFATSDDTPMHTLYREGLHDGARTFILPHVMRFISRSFEAMPSRKLALCGLCRPKVRSMLFKSLCRDASGLPVHFF